MGKVAGSFYLIMVDREPGLLLRALAHTAALYAAATGVQAAATFLTGWLALRWRRRLARHLHARYCAGAAFFHLQQQQQQPQPHHNCQGHEPAAQQAAGGGPCAPEPTASSSSSSAVDNPDQRMTADTAALCDSLAAVVAVAAAAPFKLGYYSWLTGGYVGWRGLAAVYAFFLGGSALQR